METRTPQERGARFLMLGSPILLVGLFFLGVGGLIVVSWIGGSARGEAATLRFESSCPAELLPIVRARGEAIGLGEMALSQEGDTVLLRAVLPGNPDDLTAVPALLSQPGRFAVYGVDYLDQEPEDPALATEVDITSSWFQLGIEGHAQVHIELQPNAVRRIAESEKPAFVFVLDGVTAGRFQESGPPEVDDIVLAPSLEKSKDEVRQAVDWHVVLDSGPVPCAVETSVSPG